ncbi:MAG: NifB/NifX family molybdenum-iron cluster-binding protein [Candidatus Thermoplasmatota archaeon]|nr:NifB/NifX family molybdenum-iron cluster-binding protein [Candidatus Thermoplasmatota archaeon]
MKICITSTGKDLHASVDQRFGRCPYFLIIDTESKQVKTIDNESTIASGGAGIQAAQIVTNEKVGAVITGNVGPNAFNVLHAAGIKVFSGASGTIQEVLEQYSKGKLQEVHAATQASHFGLGGHIP